MDFRVPILGLACGIVAESATVQVGTINVGVGSGSLDFCIDLDPAPTEDVLLTCSLNGDSSGIDTPQGGFVYRPVTSELCGALSAGSTMSEVSEVTCTSPTYGATSPTAIEKEQLHKQTFRGP